MDDQNRTKRSVESRESQMRPKRWVPPQLLPEPEKEDGWDFRWICPHSSRYSA